MTVLEFARGPALWLSIFILLAGTIWRIAGIFRFPVMADLSEPRGNSRLLGAVRTIVARMVPRREFGAAAPLATLNAYVYHIGLAVIVFGFLPHMLFIERLTGLSWPVLPVWAFNAAVALTFVSMLAALAHRMGDPVRRMLSNVDDYFSWAVVFLPLVTGMAALYSTVPQTGPAAAALYPGPLAVHLLSVELLLVWLPFGKLGHAFLVFISRATAGAACARRGSQA